MMLLLFPISSRLNWAEASSSQMRKPVEENPWRKTVTVLITLFENDELWKHKPAQMCKLWPQWVHSLGLSSASAVREGCWFVYDCSQTGCSPSSILKKKRNKGSIFASPLLNFTPWTCLHASASKNDRFHQSRSWCLTDKRSVSTVVQRHIRDKFTKRKITFCNSTYWDDCNLLGPSKMKKKKWLDTS